MGRGRGKGRKSTAVSHEDLTSGTYKRRGRPQKTLNDNIDEERTEKIKEEEEGGDVEFTISSKEVKSPAPGNGKKRKNHSEVKEDSDSIVENNGYPISSNTEESTKSNGFRQNGSRRKNKPRRAAEAGVECK